MLRSPSLLRSALVASALVTTLASGLHAANRLRVESVTLLTNSTGNVVPIRMDADQNVLGFSIYMEYDVSKVNITGVSLGEAVEPLDPEWSDGTIDNTRGELSWGVVFDLSGPTLTKELPAGTNLEVLRLTVDVLVDSDTTVTLNLTNINSSEPRRVNVIADTEGKAVSPAPTLQDGTVIIEDLAPRIDTTSYVDNEGDPGQVFRVAGENFDQPGLAVSVCGKEAEFSLVENGRALEITAPDCEPGTAAVEVCTDFGCDVDLDGFAYAGIGNIFKRGDSNEDGTVNITDGIATLGFLFTGRGEPPGCRDAADANDDGLVNITDPVATFEFLFRGTAPIPFPFQECGEDPTSDNVSCDQTQDACP